jgi:NADH-quinone oxidoreductase subunit M
MNGHHVISIVTFTPLLGAIVLAFLKPSNGRLAQGLALAFCALGLLHALMLWVNFDATSGRIQFEERADWIPSIGADSMHVEYYVGVDGLGLLMVMLTAIVTPVAILASRKIEDKAPQYYSLMLFLQAGLFGTFTALNFVHWFAFWELSLVPAFFLIKFWGGPGRSAAATQFFIYTMVGSVAMLLSFLAIYHAVGTFDFIALAKQGSDGTLATSLNDKYAGWHWLTQRHTSLVIFAGVFLGFAVKVPLIPFHTWLPATYAEAPTGTTMMLTGLMSKMGVYGFLRVLLPLFPSEMRLVLTPLLWLAVVTIVCSACAAFAQKDLKRVFAYSSINHLGYCLLGIFSTITISDRAGDKAAALNGVLLQMFSHGLTAPMLFCFVGFLEQRSGGVRGLNDFGGLRKVAPVFCGLMGISIFASLGLPGLNGFVGEFLIFKGSFPLATWATALSVIGLLVTAIFLLTVIQRVFNGPLNEKWAAMPDLDWRERFIVLPATALMFLIGICPQILIGAFNTTVMHMVGQLKF